MRAVDASVTGSFDFDAGFSRGGWRLSVMRGKAPCHAARGRPYSFNRLFPQFQSAI